MAETLKNLSALNLQKPDLAELRYVTKIKEAEHNSEFGFNKLDLGLSDLASKVFGGLTTLGAGFSTVVLVAGGIFLYCYCRRSGPPSGYAAPQVILPQAVIPQVAPAPAGSGSTDLPAPVAVHLSGPFQCWTRLPVHFAKAIPATKVQGQDWLLWFSLLRRRRREVLRADRGVGLLGQPVQDQVSGSKIHRRRGQRRRTPSPFPQDLRRTSSICPESW